MGWSARLTVIKAQRRLHIIRRMSLPDAVLPLFLQIADVQNHQACVWLWHPSPDAFSLVWRGQFGQGKTLTVDAPRQQTGWTTTTLLTALPRASVVTVTVTNLRTGQHAQTAFSTPAGALASAPLRFGWGGDVCGQGYGRHAQDGLQVFAVLKQQAFDFFILCGDLIYADHALPQDRPVPGEVPGTLWPNALDNPYAELVGWAAPADVAQTLDAFRAKYLYLWADAHYRQFIQTTPMVYVLDDHEIYNNWTRDTRLDGDDRYPPSLTFETLRGDGLRAWHEFAPSAHPALRTIAPGFKVLHHGPWLDVFVIDARSQRAANSSNLQPVYGVDTHWLGPTQLGALTDAMTTSTAVWKLLVSGTPLSTLVRDADALPPGDGTDIWDGVANGDHGLPLGRELEVSQLLSSLKQGQVDNLVVLSGDVHFASAVHYSPQRAAFKDFSPFWEFINGPLHAGGFPAKPVDRTFGAQQVFVSASPWPATPPGPHCTSFGVAEIDRLEGVLTVRLCDESGQVLFSQSLQPLRRDPVEWTPVPRPPSDCAC